MGKRGCADSAVLPEIDPLNRLGATAVQRCRRVINKIVASPEEAMQDIQDGATVMIGGFGTAGMPSELIDALIAEDEAKRLAALDS